MKSVFAREGFFSANRREIFAFHERDDAFELLTPPADDIEVLSKASTLAPSDDVVRFVSKFLFLRFNFEFVHTVYEPPALFVDEQRRGLFNSWRHRHSFVEAGCPGYPAAMLRDEITYSHPLLPFFDIFVKRRLRALFAERHRTTASYVHRPRETAADRRPIIVTGATGLIGRRICEILIERGHRVVALVRRPDRAAGSLPAEVECVEWDFTAPERGGWRAALDGARGVIHCAGTPLFKQRWTPAFKHEMEESRVLGTRQLVEAIRDAEHKPDAFVTASAVGIYGTDPELDADESTPPGDDLLADICVKWEAEALRLAEVGVRTVPLRVGIVLSTESGALKEMLPPFKFGLGGPMGDPKPWLNWVHLEDTARIFVMALFDSDMSGAFNCVAPEPVRNGDFARALAGVLRRPAMMKYPTAMMKMIIGEAGEYASGGSRVSSSRIEEAGYRFFFRELEPALRNSLGRA